MMTALRLALSVLAWPIVWPALLWRSARHMRRHEARRARTTDEASARAAIGRARSAIRSIRGSSTLASGYEEDVLFDVEGTVVRWSPAIEAALIEAAVPTTDDEGRSYGIGAVLGCGFWIVATLAWSSLLVGSWPLAILAVLALIGLVLLGLS